MEILGYAVDGWGVGELAFEGEKLLYHRLPAPRRPGEPDCNHPQGVRETPRVSVPGEVARMSAGCAPDLARRFQRYFAGEPVGFEDVELDLDWCTTFQRSLVATLRAVPRGETITYGELAALAGHPNAQRAAGSFCAANRFGIVVPCHRVVAANGLGSYGSLGPSYKRRLLELEGAEVPV